MPRTMKAAVFAGPGRIELREKPVPEVGPLDALVRVTTTTICGTDVHILKGEYPVAEGLTVGHEPVGVVERLGSAVKGYEEGQRVIAGAITPSGHSNACLCGFCSQDGPGTAHGWKPIGGWKFGNTIDGCQAEYVLVPDAMANLAAGAGRAHGRAGADVPGHHVHRLRRRGERDDPHRRHRGGVRPGADRPLRHRRREADGGDAHHRRGPGAGAPRDGAPAGRGRGGGHLGRPTRWRRSAG